MHEGTQHAHGDIEHMADDYDEDERHPAETAIAKGLQANGVEGLAEFGTSQAQGIQTQVTQHVAEQARGRVVGFPQARTEVKQRIAFQVVEEENAQGGEAA